jgi:hypothetical protein
MTKRKKRAAFNLLPSAFYLFGYTPNSPVPGRNFRLNGNKCRCTASVFGLQVCLNPQDSIDNSDFAKQMVIEQYGIAFAYLSYYPGVLCSRSAYCNA